MRIRVKPLTRVEGHGGIYVEIDEEGVRDAKFEVFEGPRFFESIIRGFRYELVPDIMRRICAICTASHSLASIRAIEDALKVEISEQTKMLRDLLIHGEMIESHSLHLFALALPDYLGFPSVIQMAEKYPEEVRGALQLKKAGNMVHVALSGREVHGMNERVGGFSSIPSEDELEEILKTMREVRKFALLSVDLFSSLEIPGFPESENVLLASEPYERFGFLGEKIRVSNGEVFDVHEYRSYLRELSLEHSRAKHVLFRNRSFMVGALSRVHLFGERLEGEAGELYRENREKINPENSLTINLAQAIELVHSVDRCIEIIEELLSRGIEKEEFPEIEVFESRGTSCVEAPRGTLIHSYELDEKGRIISADVITPTAMNSANIEKDLRVSAERLLRDEEIERKIQLIPRAYDPCISCATHLIVRRDL
ncbi:MAG: sulfhydrogenase subunit alpha [Archaeoglobi archaeon]|nr:sulfhydrogenase subunit alpha [Archaeoglobi archaeon]